jgi:CDP-diacylglycerol--serine O-phosphatidyltransferase
MRDEFYTLYISMISFLLVSRIPTFSIKKISVDQKYVLPIMLASILLIGLFLNDPWLILSIVSMFYFILIPFSIRIHKKYKNKQI